MISVNVNLTKRILPILALLISYSLLSAKSVTVPSKEFKTISAALVRAKTGDTIWVKDGIYRESIAFSSGITLISRSIFKSVIDASGSENGVSIGNGCTISGFEIRNARIGVYSEGKNISILKCFIHRNQQSGIVSVGHLPAIEDNIIVNNGGSGVQGWDVRSTISSVNHNTIAHNGNNGIAIGGNSEVTIENNIISFNGKLGIKADPEVKIKQIKNNFYLNSEIVTTLPEGNFSFPPQFISPGANNYLLAKDSKARNMASDGKSLGTRVTY